MTIEDGGGFAFDWPCGTGDRFAQTQTGETWFVS
jgi:hypothetical protein